MKRPFAGHKSDRKREREMRITLLKKKRKKEGKETQISAIARRLLRRIAPYCDMLMNFFLRRQERKKRLIPRVFPRGEEFPPKEKKRKRKVY